MEALRDAILYGKKVNTHGGDRKSEQDQPDIVRLKLDYGNSETYTVRRLKRDRPDLAEKVLAGEMSANAGAIEAGFRDKTLTVSSNVDKAARTLRVPPVLVAQDVRRVARRVVCSTQTKNPY